MEQQTSPKKWKMALITWICIYPLINLLFILLMPHIGHLPNLLKTLILTLILVPVSGIFIGLLQKRFKNWLHR
jgi:hypothetical protein